MRREERSMASTKHGVLGALALRARNVAVMVIAQLWPGRDFASLERQMRKQPLRIQAELTAGVMGLLFLLALFAGQFGPLGIMLYFAAVLFTIR